MVEAMDRNQDAIDDVILDVVRGSGKVNIIVAGKTGVGKSTLTSGTGSAIILGVGFEKQKWDRHIDNISDYSEMPTDRITINSGCLGSTSNIRWAVLTTQY
jgi:hypothetical protein